MLVDYVSGRLFGTKKWALQKSAMAIVITAVAITVGQLMLSYPFIGGSHLQRCRVWVVIGARGSGGTSWWEVLRYWVGEQEGYSADATMYDEDIILWNYWRASRENWIRIMKKDETIIFYIIFPTGVSARRHNKAVGRYDKQWNAPDE